MKKVKKLLIAMCMCLAVFLCTPKGMPDSFGSITAEAASKVKLNKKKATLYVGETLKLKVKGTKSKVKWSSNKKSVATVTSKGKVKAKKKGTATITAKVDGKKYKCKVTVKGQKEIPVSAIGLSEYNKSVVVGSQFVLSATIVPANATNKNIVWQSINNNVATVNNGVVTAVGVGTTQIYVTATNGVTAYCTVTVDRDYLAEFNALSLDEKLLVYTVGKIKERCTTEFEIRKMYSGTVVCPYQWSGSQAVRINYVPRGHNGLIPNYGSMYDANTKIVTAIGSYSGEVSFYATKEYTNTKELISIYNGLINAGYSLKELMNAQS